MPRSRSLPALVARAFVVIASVAASIAEPAAAQTFGRSKVQYDHFDFRIQPTPHFSVYFYPAESLATADAARMAERWYQRHSTLLNLTFENNPLIFYADPPDFQQSNVVEGEIGVGTGGITEGGRDRVIMPFTGVYADNDHVLGHELVHVFQYRIAQSTPAGIRAMGQIPLWLIEGMAEYLSIGRNDPNTAMWLRDAARRNDLPTIKQLTNDPRYFPYRYGQALWAYIGGRWGDPMVNTLYRAALREGWERSLQTQLGVSADSLSAQWHAAIRQQYAGVLSRTAPDALGRGIINVRENGDQNVSPSVSPDGRFVAFFSSRNLFGIDLFVAEAATGRVVRQLTNVTRNPHFDALSFINSAGTWSPDGQRVAVVTFAQGDNEIDILNVSNGRVERRVRVPGVPALADPAWSPDGRTLAFSGIVGGISDLWLYDLQTGAARRLTNDREAQLQPAWSPDGRTIAFATDADPNTRFDALQFSDLRVALIDSGGGNVRLLPRTARGKSMNPQFTPAGDALYFVSDQDGISDIYRMALDGTGVTRVTTTATGVSGISNYSPAISVARSTGDIVFSVFDKGGFSVRTLSPAQVTTVIAESGANAGGTVTAGATGTLDAPPAAGILPPSIPSLETQTARNYIERALSQPETGLPRTLTESVRPYRARLSLESIGGATVGASIGGGFGTGIAGGIAFGFSDMLGNQLVNTVLQVNGTVKDFAGQLQYLNRERRLNYGAVAQHIPFTSVGGNVATSSFNIGGQQVPGLIYTQVLQRQFFDDVSGVLQYPLTATRRLEFTAGAQRVSYNVEVESTYVAGSQVVRERRASIPTGLPALTFGTGTAALVGDFSFFGFTSPVAGGRYRFEAAPYVGSINYQTLLADYRRYFFKRPFTLAVRGLHYGRYGKGADDQRLQELYVGQSTLVRGYNAADFRVEECSAPEGAADGCPQFTRLRGTRIGVASMELRIPLLGTEQLGLINLPYIPVEIAPFVDAGVAWSKGSNPDFRFDRNTADRVPVFSTGVTARINVLGYAVVEVFYARPFQRPGRGNLFGFQLAPGW
ncbi:MAG: peptidase S9 [Gemmatimonadota bacterium]